jgi:putative transposase
MPWMETHAVDQRTEFVLQALRNIEPFDKLCRQFGVSRKTGYKWKERFLREGLAGLPDRSRRPASSPTELSEAMVCRIVKLKCAHPSWGPRKLRAVLERTVPKAELPSESSFKRILDKTGLVERRRRVPSDRSGRLQSPARAQRPNHVWTIDFKGWWYTRNRHRFEPLTIRDDFSRYVLCAQALDDGRAETVQRQMVRIFERHGLPEVIRSDNGSPFAACNSPLGLSRLSAWWLSLGIDLDRIAPGRPDQNGGHERMHRDVAREVECCATDDASTQQAALDVWRRTFNEERPHEALGMHVPQDFYSSSPRKFDPTPAALTYPGEYLVRKVNGNGSVRIHSQRIKVSLALRGFDVGLQPTSTNRLGLWFCRLRLGDVDLEAQKFTATVTPDSITDTPSPDN